MDFARFHGIDSCSIHRRMSQNIRKSYDVFLQAVIGACKKMSQASRFHFTWLCVDIWDKYSALPIKRDKKTGFRQTKTKFFVFLYYLVVKLIVHHIGISKFLYYILSPVEYSNGALTSSVPVWLNIYLFASRNL